MQKLTPAKYPHFVEALLSIKANPWVHTEVSMRPDVIAWSKLSKHDRLAISSILQGFTQLEQFIGCYWRQTVANAFEEPEIIGLATEFASQEVTHAYAYEHLEASLGLDTYEAMLTNPSAMHKLGLYINCSTELNESLAFMSGIGEGVSLFSSFLVLLSYPSAGFNLLGLKQILSWSVRDESIHSDFACQLYKMHGKPVSESWMHEAMQAGVDAELKFIEPIFCQPLASGLLYEEAEQFVYWRANDRLKALGFSQLYDVNEQVLAKPRQLFELQVQSTTFTDFFVMRKAGGNYTATAGANLLDIDFSIFA